MGRVAAVPVYPAAVPAVALAHQGCCCKHYAVLVITYKLLLLWILLSWTRQPHHGVAAETETHALTYCHLSTCRYNFDWDPEPGSVEYMINQRIKRGAELNGRRALRMAGNLDAAEAEAAAEEAAAASGVQPGQLLAEVPEEAGAAAAAAGPGSSRQQQQQRGRAGGLPFGSITAAAGSGLGSLWMSAPLASVSLSQGMGKASKAVMGTLARAARRAPTLSINSGRARLSRPATSSSSSRKTRQQ